MPTHGLRFTAQLPTVLLTVALLSALVVGLWNAREAEAFIAEGRWTVTATELAGVRGTPASLTWSIVPDGTEIRGGGTSDLVQKFDEHFGVADRSAPLSSRPWMALFDVAFRRWSEVGGVSFEYEPFDDGAVHRQTPGQRLMRGDIRLAAKSIDGMRGVLASSQFPDGSDITIDSDGLGYLLDPADDYLRFRNTLMHEIGHTLGLEHVISSDAMLLMEPELSLSFDGPQLDEVRGLHYLYGDRFERPGNNSWQQATSLGPLDPARARLVGGDAGTDQALGPNTTDFLSISGRLDQDFYSFRVDRTGFLDVQLTPLGGRFRQAALGDVQLLTDASASSNLSLSLLDSTGATLIEVDEALHGGLETLNRVQLDATGEYFLRVRGTRDTVQLYSLRMNYQYGIPIPEAESSLILTFGCVILFRITSTRRLMDSPERLNVRE